MVDPGESGMRYGSCDRLAVYGCDLKDAIISKDDLEYAQVLHYIEQRQPGQCQETSH